jgi:hypothetical protein
MIKGKECLAEIKGISLRLTDARPSDAAISLNSIDFLAKAEALFLISGPA